MQRSVPAPPVDAGLRIGRWRVDPRADEIEADGEVLKLEPLKMRLLLALAARPGEVVLTQELLDTVWAGLVVTPASVYQGIAQLRRVLGDEGADGERYIDTVPRKGYRLVAPVQPWMPSPPSEPVAAPPPGLPDSSDPSAPSAPATSITPVRAAADRRRWLLAGALGVGAAALAGWGAWRGWSGPALPVRIAVLPFSDRSAGSAEPALSLGLALDVIHALERFPDVDVVAGESVLALGQGAGQAAEAVRRLQVGFLLQGDLDRVGATVRVAVRLLAWPGERVYWHRQFQRTIETVSLLPQAIAAEAAEALHLPVPAPGTAASAGPSEAYEFYVLGQDAWRPKTPEAFAKARDYYQRGIEIDPGFARNYIGLGWTWLGQMSNGGGIDWREAFARATPLFDKALRLEPDSAEAMTAQGVLHSQAGRYDEARRLFGEALRRNPGYAQAHHSFGVAEFDDGWPLRALPHFRRAAELNPLSLSPVERLGLASVTAGRLDEADAAYRRAVELEPRHPNGHWGLGIAAYARGALDQAVRHYREALSREPRRPFLWGELAWLCLDLGLVDEAAEAFGRQTALLPRSRWPRTDASFAWLARSSRGEVPDELSIATLPATEEGTAIDVMLVRAMAGLPLDEAYLERALAAVAAQSGSLDQPLWFLFQGHCTLLDLAAVYGALGREDRARPWLERAGQQLDRYERQGNVWHALAFHRARWLAMRGQHASALDALEAAARSGSRRGWWWRLDPALAGLRDAPRFRAVLAAADAVQQQQRARLKG